MSALILVQGFFGTSASRLLIAVVAAVAVGALVSSIAVLMGHRQARLDRRLAGYEMPEAVAAGSPATSSLAPETATVQQAMEMTSRFHARTGLLAKTERLLEQADLPFRAAEVLFYVPMFAVLAFLLVAIVFGPIAGLITAVVVIAVPYVYLSRRTKSRLERFERQLPDTLTLLASSLRAGFSLLQALETLAQETAEPSRRELQRVFTEVRLGRPVEEALAEVAERMGSRDLAWTVMAIGIQREVGGNLAVLLDTVADTMTKRQQLRREVSALTAEGRLSAVDAQHLSTGHRGDPLAVPSRLHQRVVPSRHRGRRHRHLHDPDRHRMVLAQPHRRHRGLTCPSPSFSSSPSSRPQCCSARGRSRPRSSRVRRLARSTRTMAQYGGTNVRQQEMLESIGERVLAPVGSGLLGLARRFTPAGYVESLKRKIVLAGSPPGYEVDRFLVGKVLAVGMVIPWFLLVFVGLGIDGFIGLVIVALLSSLVLLRPGRDPRPPNRGPPPRTSSASSPTSSTSS